MDRLGDFVQDGGCGFEAGGGVLMLPNRNKILVIAPLFEGNWFQTIEGKFDIEYYNELDFLKKNKIYKIIQALAYFLDSILPRFYALSGYVRLRRLNKYKAEYYYRNIDAKCRSYEQILIVKGFGAKEEYFSYENRGKIVYVLWDSLARYQIDNSMYRYLIATTSPYDAINKKIGLLRFTKKRVNKKEYSDVAILKSNMIYIGRFSFFRLVKGLYWLILLPKLKVYLGKSPLNIYFGRMQLAVDYIKVDETSSLHVTLSDLNEDSPSARIDGSCDAPVITDLHNLDAFFPDKSFWHLRYFSATPMVKVKTEKWPTIKVVYLNDLLWV